MAIAWDKQGSTPMCISVRNGNPASRDIPVRRREALGWVGMVEKDESGKIVSAGHRKGKRDMHRSTEGELRRKNGAWVPGILHTIF